MKRIFTTRKLAQVKMGRLLPKACLVILALFTFNSNVFAQAVAPGVAPMAPPPGGFGIDGDLRALFPTPGTFSTAGDWLPSGCPALPVAGVLQCNGDTIPNLPKPYKAYHFVDLFNSGDDVFSGGEKKNTYIQNISWKNGNPSPAKTDINHFMMHIAKDANNDIWIVLSGDREEVTGNSFISLQMLQEKLVQVSSPTKSFVSDAPASTGGRTEGDLQISAEFTGGGGNPNLYLERWEKPQGSQVYKWVAKTYSAGDAYGAVNSSIITNNAYSMFGGNTYQPNAFIEVGVNISDIIEDVSGQECFGKISTLWVQTKTSQSETAALSDFVTPIQINLDINLEPDAGPDKEICAGGSTTIGTAAQSGITYSWSPSTGLSDASVAQPTASPSATTEYTLTISQTGGNSNCNFTDKVTVTVNPNPTVTGPVIGAICEGETSASLTYTSVSTGVDKYRIEWNTAAKTAGLTDVSLTDLPANGGAISINTTNLDDGTYSGTIYVKNSTTGCESSGDPISLTVNPLPDILNLDIDPICEGETTASITYTGVTNGANQYKIDWESGGPADVSTYTALPASPITIPNTGSLNPGSYDGDLYVKNSTTGCISVKHVVILVVNANPAGPEVEYIAPLCYQSTFSIKIKGVLKDYKYTILDKNGSTINGKIGGIAVSNPYTAPNTNDILVTDIPAGLGYQVKVESIAGCESGFTSCEIPNGNRQAAPTTQPTLGNANDLIAYPVPFSESVTVEFKATKAENYVINLYDLQGHLVRELKAGNAKAGEVIKVQVSGQGMAESMYLVRKVSKSGISTVKLLKKQ